MWFLAPPSACTRLPCAAAVPYTYRAIGVDPTKLTARTSGCVSTPSTASLSPWSTVKTPAGRPASAQSAAIQFAARVALARLEHERVAARDRDREHPHRDHRREVERRDAGHDAERLAHRVHVGAGGDRLRVPPLEQVWD